MAGNSVLVVLAPNGRRETVKVTPNTSILQVLEDVCQKQNLDPSDWDLKHYNRIIELANSVRFSGLPNKATLEMVQNTKPRKESTINLGFQLESGKRLMASFTPNQTLWEVIKHWEANGETVLNGSTTGTSSSSIQPVCVYMRQEIVGQEELEKRTLRSLGLTQGSACIRFLHRSEDQLKHQANVSAPLSRPTLPETIISKDEDASAKAKATTVAEPQPTTASAPAPYNWPELKNSNKLNDTHDVKKDSESEQMDMAMDTQSASASLDSVSQSQSHRKIPEPELIEDMEVVERPRISKKGELHIIGEHDGVVYHRDDVSGPSNYHIPDDFFELTRGDIESMYRTLVAKRRELEDAPLTTSTLKQQEHDNAVLRNLKEHPVSVIRVRFPDRFVLQGIFRGVDSVGAVEKFVRSHLANRNMEFYLYTSPPKTILHPDQRLVEQNLVGNAVVYFGSNDPTLDISGAQILSPELQNKLSCPDAINEYLRTKGKDQKKPEIDSVSLKTSSSSEPETKSTAAGASGSGYSQAGQGPSSKSQAAPTQHHSASSANNTQKVPKWFKSTK